MSQQINLLPTPPQQPLLSASNGALLLMLFCALLGLQAWSGSRDVDTALLVAENSAHALKTQQQLMQALQNKLNDGDSLYTIAAQIAALEPQTRLSRDLLERLKTGEIGSLDGYAQQLTEFASIPQHGVWVTRLTISNAGRTLRVDGRSLKKDQVLTYAAMLNKSMSKHGIVLAHMEVAPMQQTSDDDPSATSIWTFRLY
jgi:Tfp pilus assembly protein PilN